MKDVAFQERFSTRNAPGRGRGLLEIQEAVERLGRRNIRLYEGQPSEYRLRIAFRWRKRRVIRSCCSHLVIEDDDDVKDAYEGFFQISRPSSATSVLFR